MDQSFEAYYKEQIEPELGRLEELRKEELRRVRFMWGSAIVSLVLAFVVMTPPLVILFLLISLGLYFFFFGFNRKRLNFKTEYKKVVVSKIVQFVSPELTFTPNLFIPEARFNASKLFLADPDIYNGEDLVSGMVGKTHIEFCELHTKDRTTDSRGRTTYTTIFKGIFYIADFNKHFQGQTYILSDFGERFMGAFGRFFQNINMMRPDVVRMEDPEFEKHFAVYATDPVEARYILSPSFMERLLAYRKKTNTAVQFSFVENHMYIAVPWTVNLFEPSVRRTVMNPDDVLKIYTGVKFCTDLVNDLDLNTRVWTKQ